MENSFYPFLEEYLKEMADIDNIDVAATYKLVSKRWRVLPPLILWCIYNDKIRQFILTANNEDMELMFYIIRCIKLGLELPIEFQKVFDTYIHYIDQKPKNEERLEKLRKKLCFK